MEVRNLQISIPRINVRPQNLKRIFLIVNSEIYVPKFSKACFFHRFNETFFYADINETYRNIYVTQVERKVND